MARDQDTEAAQESVVTRATAYLFGRNTLIGIAEIMLLLIAGYATWHGMRDFIVGVSATSGAGNASEGLSVSNDLLVIAVCIVLTFLMWLALRETFGAQRRLRERLITAPLYIFLALWSIGFGYGFWWSLIAGQEATRTGLSGLQEDARDAAGAIAARLDAVKGQLDSVVSWSDGQMSREETSGGSCGVASGAGRGPLYNARRSVRDSVTTLRDGMQKAWLEPVQFEVAQLQQAASGFDGSSVEERQKKFEAMASQIRGKARSIASRSNELGRSTAAEMRALAETVAVQPGKPGFACHDPTLAQRLRQAADQAEQPAVLTLREAEFNEGPAGVANAIKKLWGNIGTYMGSLIRYVFSGGTSTGNNTAGGEPITGRDLIALLATIGIDLGLLAMAALNPTPAPPAREDGAADAAAKVHTPHPDTVKQLRPAFRTAIARAPGEDTDFEWVRRHFVHHNGSSYFVIPNLYSVKRDDTEELKALAVNQLAGVFDDLELIRALTPKELIELGKEEMRDSYSDLTPFREMKAEAGNEPPERKAKGGFGGWLGGGAHADRSFKAGSKRIRNHGLLSKAERVLGIAGWSEEARRDAEIYRLVNTEGLTPLLMVLIDADEDESAVQAAVATATKAAPAAPDGTARR